jgi:stage III sporulation protein AE
MKRIIGIFFIIIILFIPVSNAEDEILEQQQEELGINAFIEKANEYSGEFLEGIEIKEIFNNAINGQIDNNQILEKVLSLFGTEFMETLKSIAVILVIIVIHSILKAVSENLENSDISKLIYYAQYILIVTIVMSNFSDISKMVQDSSADLVAFMNTLIPLLMALVMYTGSITTTSIIEPIILIAINFISNLIQNVIIPVLLVFVSISVISKISNQTQLNKLNKLFKSGVIWVLGIIMTIFVGIMSLEGTLSSSIDGITAKTAKSIVSSSVPVVGKILGDVVDSVLGSGIILKNAVGFVGVIVVIGMCITPIIKLLTLTISYKILAAVSGVIADEKIVELLDEIGDIFKIFLAILASLSAMLIIGTALVLRISNSGMMYR